MDDRDLSRLTLSEAASLIATHQLSPSDLTSACIARAERLEPRLNAFFTRTFEKAMQAAREADTAIASGGYLSPLHGIPFGLKDLFNTAGIVTTAGSPMRWNYLPAEDAEVVTRLKQAGAILLGKLNMHEWALGTTNVNVFFASPRNPWDLGRITGGSSGGCGAAIAAGLCLGSLGSDTRGSIRIPASLCGITGLKPTYGRVSLRNVVPLNWSLDHVGPMARTAADCALILQATAGFDPEDPTSIDQPVPDYVNQLRTDLRGVRIGVPGNFFFDPDVVDSGVAEAVLAARDVFESLGAEVKTIEFPAQDLYLDGAAFHADGAAFHESRLREQPQAFSEEVRRRFEAGFQVSGIDYSRARYHQAEFKLALHHLFSDIDLLLTPTTPMTAPPFPKASETIPPTRLLRNTAPFNLAGVPAISLSCGFSDEGLPIGMQLAGRPWEEGLVLGAAHAYQQITDWHRRAPPATL